MKFIYDICINVLANLIVGILVYWWKEVIKMKFTGIDGATIIAILSLIGNGLQMYYSGKKEKSAAELNKIKEQNNFNLQKQTAENNLKNNQEERNLKKYELQTKLSEQHFNFVSDRMQELFESYLKITKKEIDSATIFKGPYELIFSKEQAGLELFVLMYCPEAETYINKIHSYKPGADLEHSLGNSSEDYFKQKEAKKPYRAWLNSLAIIFNRKLMREEQ